MLFKDLMELISYETKVALYEEDSDKLINKSCVMQDIPDNYDDAEVCTIGVDDDTLLVYLKMQRFRVHGTFEIEIDVEVAAWNIDSAIDTVVDNIDIDAYSDCFQVRTSSNAIKGVDISCGDPDWDDAEEI